MIRTGPGVFWRLLFGGIGLLAGNAALLIVLLPHASQLFALYATFSVVGWAIVGLPIVLLLPPEPFSRLAWPLVVVVGATVGPIALFVIFVVLFAFQGSMSEFSLAHTESLWPLATLVSTVSVLVYSALVRWRSQQKGKP